MPGSLRELIEKFAALSSREQVLVLVALFAITYQVADLVVFDRQYQQIDSLNRAIAADNRAMTDLNAELNGLAAGAQRDPNRELRTQIAGLRGQVATLRQRLGAETQQMISPQDMARFLEQLLNRDDALTMLSLQTLEAEPMVPSDEAEPVRQQQAVLHRHGFEIAFSGGYLATLRYLQSLEALPWRFYWDSVSYEVIEYPRSVVRLRLHTLSLSEDWIGV